MSEPAWVKAFYAWYDKTYFDFAMSGADSNEAAAKAFANRMNWHLCDYCAGACGDCPNKTSSDFFACDPCPRDQFGVTECTYCPYQMLDRLYHLRPEQSK